MAVDTLNAAINLATAAVLAYASSQLRTVKHEATRIRQDVEASTGRDPR